MKDLEPYLIAIVLLLVFVSALLTGHSLKDNHRCNAPCNVHFKDPVMEDDVFWHWNANGYAYVYKGKH